MSRRGGNRYADWDPVGQEVAHGRRDGRAYTCRACNKQGHETDDGDVPTGWYQVKISGQFAEGDVRPGYYCGVECLAVAALLPYQMSDRAVRRWLRGG